MCIAYSGADAWRLASEQHPEALILDIGMPGMDGYEVARHVRQTSWGSQALLLASTGRGQVTDKEHAYAAGFDQHLTKPIDAEELLRLLAERARNSAVRRGRQQLFD